MSSRFAHRIAIAAVGAIALHASADVTVVNFENGAEGWVGPQGFGGSTFIDPTNGADGSAGLRTQFNDFGIVFSTDTNQAYLGDFGQYNQVTISIDVKVDQIGSFFPVGRPFMVELRDFDTAQGGYPWSSVYYLFEWIDESNHGEYTTFSVTIADPDTTDMPAGWGGYGDEDPDTFEPRLPPGVTFADILAGVDEMAFSTLLPGYFFTAEDFDVTVDNITIDTGSCVADFNGDGEVNTLDVLSFLNAWSAGDHSADFNGDGEVNTLDVLGFLNAWSAGC